MTEYPRYYVPDGPDNSTACWLALCGFGLILVFAVLAVVAQFVERPEPVAEQSKVAVSD